MHEVQLRKCSGKAAKDRGKLVKTLACKLVVGIVNSHPKEPARYNLLQFKPTNSHNCIRFTVIPYILESNPHPFYSYRGLKNQMWIRIACGLDSRSRAGFWKNDRAAVRAVRIQ